MSTNENDPKNIPNDDPWAETPPAAPSPASGNTGKPTAPHSETRNPEKAAKSSGPQSPVHHSSSPRSASREEELQDAAEKPKLKRIREKDRKAIGILGFSSSGKTVYLSMLYHATQERKLFPPEWHANWAIDDGFSRGYLSRISKGIRGIDPRGKTAYVDSTRQAVRRAFPRGSVEVTPIEFELYRKWGLTNRPLKVLTQDGMGEAIHNAATDGPTNLPAEQRAIWQSTLELCKNSTALLLFVNLVKFEDSDYTSDISFLVDWLLREGMKPKAVAIVAPGLDAWDGSKSREELRAMIREKFVHPIESLTRAGIACEIFPVSSIGRGFVLQNNQVAPGSEEHGQIIDPAPKAEPKPEFIDEPWEFIFRTTIPRWAQFEPLAVLVDFFWLLRRRLFNIYTIPLYILVAVGALVLWPWWNGRSEFAELNALAGQSSTIQDIDRANHLYDKLAANTVWNKLNSNALGNLATEHERWVVLQEIDQFRQAEMAKPAPDYLALLAKVTAYLKNPQLERNPADPHPYTKSLPLADWRIAGAQQALKSDLPMKDKLLALADMLESDLGARKHDATTVAAGGVQALETYRANKENLISSITDDNYRDPEYIEVQRQELREVRDLVARNIFIEIPGYQKAKETLDGLNPMLRFLGEFAANNKNLPRLDQTDPTNKAKRLAVADKFKSIYKDYTNRYKFTHPLLQGCLRRAVDIEKGSGEATMSAAVTEVEKPFAEFTTTLNAFESERKNIVSTDGRAELQKRRDTTLATLRQKLTKEATTLESTANTLAGDPALVTTGSASITALQSAVAAANSAYRSATRTGLTADPAMENRLSALTKTGDALQEYVLILSSETKSSGQMLAAATRLGQFAEKNSSLASLAQPALVRAKELTETGYLNEANERFSRLEDPDGAASQKFAPADIDPLITNYNAFIAQPRWVAKHDEAIARRYKLITRHNRAEDYLKAMLAVFNTPPSSPATTKAQIDIGNYFLNLWKDHPRAAEIMAYVEKIDPASNQAITVTFTRIDFPKSQNGVAEIRILQQATGRELGKLADIPVASGKLTAPAKLGIRLAGKGDLKVVVLLYTAAGGTKLFESQRTYTIAEFQPGASKMGALDDKQTLVRLEIK